MARDLIAREVEQRAAIPCLVIGQAAGNLSVEAGTRAETREIGPLPRLPGAIRRRGIDAVPPDSPGILDAEIQHLIDVIPSQMVVAVMTRQRRRRRRTG